MSGVACPHVPSAADVVGWHPAWDASIAFGQRTWLDEIACYAIIAIRKHTRSNDGRRHIPSLPLDNKHGGTTSAWYSIITLGQHILLEKVRRGMPSRLMSRTHGRTTSGVAYHHRLREHTQSDDVERRMLSSTMDCTHHGTMLGMAMVSSPFGTTQSRTLVGVKCHHCLLESSYGRMTSTLHALISLGFHTPMDNVGGGMRSSLFCCIPSRIKSSVACHHGA